MFIALSERPAAGGGVILWPKKIRRSAGEPLKILIFRGLGRPGPWLDS